MLIENVGEFPVRNVHVCDNYLYQLLKSNDKKAIVITYSEKKCQVDENSKILKLLKSEYESNNTYLPNFLHINYDDIDGNSMHQIFKLKSTNEYYYYSLEKTEFNLNI